MSADLPDAAPPVAPTKRHAGGLIALAVVAVVLAPFAVPSFGAGAVCAVVVLVVAARLRRGGHFHLRGPVITASVALVLSAVSTGACYFLMLRPAEVRGAASQQQQRVEDGFDRAFEDAKAPPPPRDAGRPGDDVERAPAAAMRDAGADPRHDGGPYREQP